jgi:hypothetical protein
MWCRYHLTLTPQRAVAWENTKFGGPGHTAPSWRHSEMFQVRRWRCTAIISARLFAFMQHWASLREMDSSDDDTLRRDTRGVALLASEKVR